MKLVAQKKLTDKQGVAHNPGEQFDVRDQQEAQEYIRSGQAVEADQQQSDKPQSSRQR